MSRIHAFAGLASGCLAICTPAAAFADTAQPPASNGQSSQPDPAAQADQRDISEAAAAPTSIDPPARSATAPVGATTGRPLQPPTPGTVLTGDWGGLRSKLAQDGLTFRADYVSETLSNIDGGERRGTGYTQQVRAGFDLDMDRLVGWTGGILHFTVNDRRGVGTSLNFIGNRLPVQEAAGGNWARLTEASVEQAFAGGKLDIRAGFFAMGNDLGGQPLGCNFLNAAFCAHPLSMSGNSGWYNYPNARWGVAIRYRPKPEWAVRTGAYQVTSDLALQKNAFNPFAGGTTGVLLPLEVEFDPGASPNNKALPGHYKVGAYYDTSRVARMGGSGMVRGRYAVYVLADQMVWREKANPARGLTVFGQLTLNPRATSQITRWYAGGLVKIGTFAGRDADTLALGAIHAAVNPRLRGARVDAGLAPDGYASLPQGETAIELSYGYQARGWLLVRPDVQYIVDPGAFTYSHVKNALAVGGQVKVQF